MGSGVENEHNSSESDCWRAVGSMLQNARNAKRISLEQISRPLRMSVEKLTALENGCIGETFAGYWRLHCRTYAKFLGIPEEELAEKLPQEKKQMVIRNSSLLNLICMGISGIKVTHGNLHLLAARTSRGNVGWHRRVIMIVLLLLLGLIVFQGWHYKRQWSRIFPEAQETAESEVQNPNNDEHTFRAVGEPDIEHFLR